MASGAKKIGNTFVWILLAMLIVGLAGFGATNFSGTIRTIGTVGSVPITTDAYFRALQNQLNALQAQTGQPAQPSQLQAFGLDRVALEQLVVAAALDNEVAELGLSVGDEELQREIISYPAFQGVDGSFNREAYAFTLQQAGMNEVEFEADIRADRASRIVQEAILASVAMPDAMTDTIVDYVAARRSFVWSVVDASALDSAPAAPTDAELQVYYDAKTDQFMLPEARQITYAWLRPSDLIDSVTVEEADVQRAYEERSAEFNLPERRLVERLVFSDTAAAEAALDRITSGEATFETLVTDRGLSLTDVDLGDVEQAELGSAGSAVFAAEAGDVVGPLDSDLGPALYNIGGVLAANVTPFEDVRDELRDELALGRAAREIERMAQDVDDLLAGGATLEELPAETEVQTGKIAYSALSEDEIAAYDAFREAAETVTTDDYPEVTFLDDGGIFAIRLDDVIAPRAEPFDEAREKVRTALEAERLQEALTARANDIVTQLAVTGDFATQGLQTRVENGLTRSAYIDGTPQAFMEQVFAMEEGDMQVIPAAEAVIIVQLTGKLPPEDNAELTQLRNALQGQLNDGLSQDLFAAFSRAAFMRAERNIDQRAVDAVLNSFQ